MYDAVMALARSPTQQYAHGNMESFYRWQTTTASSTKRAARTSLEVRCASTRKHTGHRPLGMATPTPAILPAD